MDPSEIPVVRVELDAMKSRLQQAFMLHTDDINKIIQSEMDKYCTVENLTGIIQQQVKSTVSQTLQDQIEHYYKFGPGYHAIKLAVNTALGKFDVESINTTENGD